MKELVKRRSSSSVRTPKAEQSCPPSRSDGGRGASLRGGRAALGSVPWGLCPQTPEIFGGITLVSERGVRSSGPAVADPEARWPFGTPSTGLSLGQVASPQSLPPFRPAGGPYSKAALMLKSKCVVQTRERTPEARRPVFEVTSKRRQKILPSEPGPPVNFSGIRSGAW